MGEPAGIARIPCFRRRPGVFDEVRDVRPGSHQHVAGGNRAAVDDYPRELTDHHVREQRHSPALGCFREQRNDGIGVMLFTFAGRESRDFGRLCASGADAPGGGFRGRVCSSIRPPDSPRKSARWPPPGVEDCQRFSGINQSPASCCLTRRHTHSATESGSGRELPLPVGQNKKPAWQSQSGLIDLDALAAFITRPQAAISNRRINSARRYLREVKLVICGHHRNRKSKAVRLPQLCWSQAGSVRGWREQSRQPLGRARLPTETAARSAEGHAAFAQHDGLIHVILKGPKRVSPCRRHES